MTPLYYDDPRLVAARAKATGLDLVLGLDAETKAPFSIKLDTIAGPHALIAGASGSGKTNLTAMVAAQLLERSGKGQFQLALSDSQNVIAPLFRGLPQVFSLANDASPLEHAAAEVERRWRIFNDGEFLEFTSWNRVHSTDQLPFILVIVAEVRAYERGTADRETYEQCAGLIARKGRGAGVFLLVVAQQPAISTLGPGVLPMLNKRIALHLTSPQESHLVLGSDTDDRAVELALGEALVGSWGGPARRVNVAFLPDRGSDHPGRTINDVLDAVRAR